MQETKKKRVVLKWLRLENWRAQNRTVNLGHRTIIRGNNGTGKSTFVDAFFWLMTGADAQNRTNYDLFDNTREFSPENAFPAIVEGAFEIDGMEYVLKRSACQKWTRKRSSSEYTKSKSDEYAYYIDGLAVSAKSYNERVSEIFADVDKLRLMLNVRHYQLLDWKALRQQFADMVGVVSADELHGDYSMIDPLIAKYENEKTFKGNAAAAVMDLLKQKINPLREDSKKLKSKIEGMKEMLPSLSGVVEAKNQLAAKQSRIAEIDKEIAGIGEANKQIVDKRNAELEEILAKKREMSNARYEWDKKQKEPIEALRKQLAELNATNAEITKRNAEKRKSKESALRQLESARQQHEYFSSERDRLHEEKEAVRARTFDENQVCPNCGQILPIDKISELKLQFYDKRDADVAAIIVRGKKAAAMRDAQKALIAELEDNIPDDTQEPLIDAFDLSEQISKARESIVPFDDSAYQAEIKAMQDNLTEVPVMNTTELISEKAQINSEIRGLMAIVAKEAELAEQMAKIEVKEEEFKQTNIELAKQEMLFDKCVEREREWASIVRDRANRFLHYCRVEMTEISKAGEIRDMCSVTIDGVDVGVANTARQIIAGIDIALAFQENANVVLPLFIDNAEQICDCNMPSPENQMVTTYVDETCSELMIERK